MRMLTDIVTGAVITLSLGFSGAAEAQTAPKGAQRAVPGRGPLAMDVAGVRLGMSWPLLERR